MPEALSKELGLSSFYQKHVAVAGFPIVGSRRVSDHAMREAAWILEHLLSGREALLREMRRNRVFLVVMAYDEYTTDVPEHRHLKPRVYWDRRARGLGGSPVSCAEENLLSFPGDPYATENILIHEFAHAVHNHALRSIDRTFDPRLRRAYTHAIERGLWQGTYAATDPEEYWAEAVQSWFDDNRENDALHNQVNTRVELNVYDPELAALCREVFGDNPWRYAKIAERLPDDRAHVADYDPAAAPRFRWRDEPVPDEPRVRIRTEFGSIEIELFRQSAALTVTNFLRYVHEGLYSDGALVGTERSDGTGDGAGSRAVQGCANPDRRGDFFPAIPAVAVAERAALSAGALVMDRNASGTAQDRFWIMLGDPTEQREEVGSVGDAPAGVFGRVVKGLDVVEQIHALREEDSTSPPEIRIQRAIRLN